MQMLDLRRALHGTGNFRLTNQTQTFYVAPYIWQEKTQTDKKAYFNRFLKSKKGKISNFVLASRADFHCPRPKQTCGKKTWTKKTCKISQNKNFQLNSNVT